MRFGSLRCCLAIGMVVAVCGVAAAQSTDVVVNEKNGTVTYAPKGDAALAAEATMAFWTPERMATAQPMPMPTRVVTDAETSPVLAEPVGTPGLVSGHPPGVGPFVPTVRWLKTRAEQQAVAAPMAFGTAPTDPLNGPYGPFQRWTMEADYLRWPRSVHGKLFFTIPGAGNYVCSATVIGNRTIATAGHCVAEGAAFHTNWMFCPSYISTGVNPARGCWSWSMATTSNEWYSGGNLDHDYACIVTAPTGTVIANTVGSQTGSAGRAWNFGDVPEVTFGYPAASPFNGTIIIETVGPDWYPVDWVAGGQVSKTIGSDLTGGSSGGGWFLGWRHPTAEVADTDGSWGTDPTTAGPYLNGVNSAKRCRTDCRTPPIATAGVFWQEMVSPPMRNTAATGESEDIFASCLNNE